MNLPQRDQRPRFAICRGERSQQNFLAIALHAGAKIVFGKADVQRPSAVAGGEAAGARGESMDQPRNTNEVCRRKNLRIGRRARFCRWTFTESWHTFILIGTNGQHLQSPGKSAGRIAHAQ